MALVSDTGLPAKRRDGGRSNRPGRFCPTGHTHHHHHKPMKVLLAGVSVLACCLGNPAGIDDTYEIDAIELAWHQCDQGDLSACERASELINFDY